MERGPFRRFADRYGWRAYALPLLTVLTVVVLLGSGKGAKPAATGPMSTTSSTQPSTQQPATPPTPTPSAARPSRTSVAAPPTLSGDQQLKVDQPSGSVRNEALASDALPAGAPYTQQGAGTYRVVAGNGPVVGSGSVHRYTIDVENGITGVNVNDFAADVQRVLSDKRSWIAEPGVALQRVDSGPVDWHVTLTTPMTTRQLCGFELKIETSCYDAQARRVVLNLARWVRGDAAYTGDLANYRVYMINHEDGHALGHSHAHVCLPDGLAPVMMQQTITLKAETGQMCAANPWPYPPGVQGAPGVEVPGT